MDTILVKSVWDIYPEWTAGKCKLFDGLQEVDKVSTRETHGKTSYIIWWVIGEWRHAEGYDTLRVEWQPDPVQPSVPAANNMPDYVRAVVPPDMPVVKQGNAWVSAPAAAAAGDVPSDGMDSLDYAVAMLQSEFMGSKSSRDYRAVAHHFEAIEQWKREALETEATLQAAVAAAQEREARLRAALRPFANSYHVYRDQYEGEYGDMLNYATDHFDGESLEVNCKAAYDALQATEPDA